LKESKLVSRESYLVKKQIIMDIKFEYLRIVSLTRYEILDTRYEILDTRYEILDTRYEILDTRY